MMDDRRLIEEWLPIAEVGIESDRERGASSALPPIYYLHTWWARRPLVISRAAVLASILPIDADRSKFIHMLGIRGDPVRMRHTIDQANREKRKLKSNPYGYSRAFTYVPDDDDRTWIYEAIGRDVGAISVVDPTAGGGSIPLESRRLGCTTTANDVNPVAALLLYATINWPSTFNVKMIKEFQDITDRFITSATPKYEGIFPQIPKNITVNGYLWARTIPCPYCSGLIPLSPNWCIAPDGVGVRLKPHIADGPGTKGRICSFQIIQSEDEQSAGTVSRGDCTCPYPDCKRIISRNEIKTAAKSGHMGEQLYAVAYKKCKKILPSKIDKGKRYEKWVKEYREPKSDDYDSNFIQTKLEEKLQEWDAQDIIPTETYPRMYSDRSKIYGINYWRDLFSPRQLLCHGTNVEVFRELLHEDKQNNALTDIRKAAYGYLAIAIDTLITYNSRLNTWDGTTGRGIRNTFARHDYGFSWSYAEMAPLVVGLGLKWAFDKTMDSLKGIIKLSGSANNAKQHPKPTITCKSGDNLDHIQDNTVDVIVMDPPYYDNVMYAELSDFFYVWLKRTAGMIYPELFRRTLTDKENEAVANPAKFTGQKKAKAMASHDYEERMRLIFEECKRILKLNGIMTVMFMHKSTGAWNALAKSIIQAGFYITSSWPINSEARGSLHIRNKGAAKSTILLACRPRPSISHTSYWEDVEPKVKGSVLSRVKEFEKAGLRGTDVYLSAFGPALEEFSRNWPMTRRTPRPDNNDDPYSVTPEDALMAARLEIKQWRLDKLICSVPDKNLDAATAFFVLAWDAFQSPKFPYDEALHLARAVGIDLEREVVGRFAKKEGNNLVLWDSQKRHTGGRLKNRHTMIDILHHVAHLSIQTRAETAIKYIEHEHLDNDTKFIAALEAVLEVLPPSARHAGLDLQGDMASASNDFEALFNIYRQKFNDKMDNPSQLKFFE